MNEILRAEDIGMSYGDNEVLRGVGLTLREGEIVGLIGASGGGKTTLFNILSGVMRPTAGRVLLRGEDVTGRPGSVSYMLQKDMLFEHMRVIDNVALPLVVAGEKKKTARERADEYFGVFGLEGTQLMYPAELSGGMRQRAALLRTYLGSHGVALLDEPFGALDTITRSKIHEWYLGVMESLDLATLFVTHDIDEAVKLSDRVLVLSGSPGRISDEVVISAGRPRPADFDLTSEFLEYKRTLTRALR